MGPEARLIHPGGGSKTPENGIHLPFSGEMELRQDETPARFVSHFYFSLGEVPANDIIKNHCPASLKASGEGREGRAAKPEPEGKATLLGGTWVGLTVQQGFGWGPQEGSWLH